MDETTKGLCKRLEAIQPAMVSDVLDGLGYPDRCLSSELLILDPKTKLVGTAYCMRGCVTVGAGAKAPAGKSKPVYEMDRHVYDGCVLVVETGGYTAGPVMGGNVITSFAHRGCRGMVIDGGIRDAVDYTEMGFPTFYRFLSPRTSKGEWEFTEIDVPVRIAGQTVATLVVNPGDVLVGDIDGVVVIPKEILGEVVTKCEAFEKLEAKIKVELERGDDREVVYNRNDRNGLFRKK